MMRKKVQDFYDGVKKVRTGFYDGRMDKIMRLTKTLHSPHHKLHPDRDNLKNHKILYSQGVECMSKKIRTGFYDGRIDKIMRLIKILHSPPPHTTTSYTQIMIIQKS